MKSETVMNEFLLKFQGDSGGPLVVNDNGTPVQVGVTSWVVSLGCAAGYPSGFSRVSSFRSWIDQTTK